LLDIGLDELVARQTFPQLTEQNCNPTSPATDDYNCAAWAAGTTDNWWWPSEWPCYWPSTAPLEVTLQAFVAAYATLGYLECENADLEDGIEKIAIYADAQQTPTHVARQLVNGKWTSKLGELKDIEHSTLQDIANGIYGSPAKLMKRSRHGP